MRKGHARVFLALVAGCAALFIGSAPAQADEIYTLTGEHSDGVVFTGTVTIADVNGVLSLTSWNISDTQGFLTQSGLGADTGYVADSAACVNSGDWIDLSFTGTGGLGALQFYAYGGTTSILGSGLVTYKTFCQEGTNPYGPFGLVYFGDIVAGTVTFAGNTGGSNSTVPEPSGLALLGAGLVGMVGMIRRKRSVESAPPFRMVGRTSQPEPAARMT